MHLRDVIRMEHGQYMTNDSFALYRIVLMPNKVFKLRAWKGARDKIVLDHTISNHTIELEPDPKHSHRTSIIRYGKFLASVPSEGWTYVGA